MIPKVCVLRTAGTNCDQETAAAFLKAGASVESVHINTLINGAKKLSLYQILAIPGGFSYGDDIAAGKLLANELKFKLAGDVSKFVADGKLIIGICNGFQVLVKSGLLAGDAELKPGASLIINDSGKFEDRWVYLKRTAAKGRSVWTDQLPEVIYLPVAHGEGKFITAGAGVRDRINKNAQAVFCYSDEKGELRGYPFCPNGSEDNIAGICDQSGRILGLMPHPERHINGYQHPRWTASRKKKAGDGLAIFKNGVEYARKNL